MNPTLPYKEPSVARNQAQACLGSTEYVECSLKGTCVILFVSFFISLCDEPSEQKLHENGSSTRSKDRKRRTQRITRKREQITQRKGQYLSYYRDGTPLFTMKER